MLKRLGPGRYHSMWMHVVCCSQADFTYVPIYMAPGLNRIDLTDSPTPPPHSTCTSLRETDTGIFSVSAQSCYDLHVKSSRSPALEVRIEAEGFSFAVFVGQGADDKLTTTRQDP